MREKEFENLYEKILDGAEDWDYSDLDTLLEISKVNGFAAGRESIKKQIDIRIELAKERICSNQNIEINQAIIQMLESLKY